MPPTPPPCALSLHQVHRVAERIVDAVSPWARFVAAEEAKARVAAADLERTRAAVQALKQRILRK